MAKIIGNLEPADDYTHALGPEPNFNESMYFNFFDRERRIGGFLRLGNRANEGHAERTVTVFLPDGHVLFGFERARIDGNDAFEAGGVRFEVMEPSQKLRTTYAGPVIDMAEPRQMAEPREAFRNNPTRQLRIDLVHDAVGPMYGSAGSGNEAERPAEEQFARAHYEQHMHVTGTIELEGQRFELDGYGLRDHSWGPRSWQAIERYEWLTLNFGAELGAMISVIRRGPGEVRTGGVVVRGDALDLVTEAEIDADYEDNGLYHTHVRARVKTARGEALDIEGEVKSFIPLRHRRDGTTTHIGEGMTEWRLGDRVGYGLSEFLRRR
ncbi:MAG: hypothetical protein JSU66_14575 [Deltaproteobacteria bacterium]|nr:MAG: hypothetical protein JSU66_14575 [Deltaproteobacteria bacterium]